MRSRNSRSSAAVMLISSRGSACLPRRFASAACVCSSTRRACSSVISSRSAASFSMRARHAVSSSMRAFSFDRRALSDSRSGSISWNSLSLRRRLSAISAARAISSFASASCEPKFTSDSSALAARDVQAARRPCTTESACAGDVPVPDPAVSRRAVTSVVLRRRRSSSLVSENMVENVSRSISCTREASPLRPSALRLRESSISPPSPSSKNSEPARSAACGL